MKNKQRTIPPLAASRAKSAGAAGEGWLADLDNIISELEAMWNISVREGLSGGTHGFAAYADSLRGDKYVLKIDMPENLGGEFPNSIAPLKMANGHGYDKLYQYGLERKACLLERLGKPVNQLGLSVYEQLRIICCALQEAWKIPVVNTGLPKGEEIVAWFREFIGDTWEKLNHPCSHRVIEHAILERGYLQTVSTDFVLLQTGQEENGRKMLHAGECGACENTKAAAREPDYMNELVDFLVSVYGFTVQSITPANRGFYGETWKVRIENGEYFVKIDYWKYHKEWYRRSLFVVQYMTDRGISFIPKLIKTKQGNLWGCFHKGVAAVFDYVQGEPSEDCSIEKLYGHLTKIYQLKADGIELETENFGAGIIDTFQSLQNKPELPVEVVKAIERKETEISRYAQRLKHFSEVCKDDKHNFYITHGDAGGNCILKDNQLFIVDWDSVMLGPVERDAWIFICDRQKLKEINSALKENGIDYILDQKRLCYYSYYFYFYYLNEYLKYIVSTKRKEQKEEAVKNLMEYLEACWIYKQLDMADRIS